MIRTPVHKQIPTVPAGYTAEELDRDNPYTQHIDFDSDEPLVCPLDKADGEPCESCQ